MLKRLMAWFFDIEPPPLPLPHLLPVRDRRGARREVSPSSSPRTYRECHEWGNAVGWQDYDRRRVTGHQRRRPRAGDVFLSPMRSGKLGRFIFTSVELTSDPPDQFFASVVDDGYEGEERA